MNNIIQLIIRDYILNKRRYLTILGAITLTLMLIFFIQTALIGEVSFDAMSKIFFFVYFLGGLIFTSNAFGELASPAKSSFYLMIPASHTDKFFAQYLTVSVLYSAVALIAFPIATTIGSSLACLGFDINFTFYEYAMIPQFQYVAIFLVIQTIFFTGALYFKNNAFFKTLLVMVVFQFAFSLVLGLFGWLVFGTHNFSFEGNDIDMEMMNFKWLETTAKLLFWVVLGPFFLTVSYFKLTEKEV